MKRHVANFAPEVTCHDLESPNGQKVYGGGKMIGLDGAPPNIQPFQAMHGGGGGGKSGGSKSRSLNVEGTQKAAAIAVGIWLLGVFLGYDWWWPVNLVLELLYSVLSIPPFSWIFSWVWTPVSWIFGWLYKGAPLVEQVGALQELRLPADQVSTYMDSYVQQYGDAALIFASHDGYPQIVNALLFNRELGYRDLIDATDENGNTALIYAAAKGYRQTTAALLRSGADPEIANQGGGGRTPLMEAAGGGHKDIVAAIRLSNATVDATDDFSNTALHYAAYHGHLSVVHELLKSNPRRDIKNSYGHTAASYALANKHKAIADLLNRQPTRKEKERAEKLEQASKEPEDEFDLSALTGGKKQHKEKHVKGGAEELHKGDWKDFAPKFEKLLGGSGAAAITDAERKSLEDQIAKLKHQHDEAELKAQKRIVELLEKNSGHQKALDDKEREARALKLNHTELSIKVQDLESKHQSTELRYVEEKQRADRLHEERQLLQMEIDRHKSRAEGAERERDLHMEASRRHEETIRRKQDEVSDHLSRLERHTRDVSSLRDDVRRKEEELRQQQDTIARLQRELRTGASAETAAPPPQPPVERPAADSAAASTGSSGHAAAAEHSGSGAADSKAVSDSPAAAAGGDATPPPEQETKAEI